MIGGVQVAGFRYVVYGTRRGLVSTHRTRRAALRSLANDARERMQQNAPSDALVYFWRAALGRWELAGESNGVELVDEPGESPLAVEVNLKVR